MNKGQIPLSVILTVGGAVGGSIMWIYNLVLPIKDAVAENQKNIAVLQNVAKSIPEMQAEIKNTNENVIRLLERQGIKPVTKETLVKDTSNLTASSTSND